MRVPVLVGHAQAIWVETDEPLAPRRHGRSRSAPHVVVEEYATPGSTAGRDEVLVGRIRRDTAGEGLSLWAVNDNLRKGAALNAIQIAELVIAAPIVAV